MKSQKTGTLKRKVLSLALTMSMVTSLGVLAAPAAFAAGGTPTLSSYSIQSSYDPNASTTSAKNLSQKVTITLNFDEAVDVPDTSAALADFNISVYGAAVGTGTMAAMRSSLVWNPADPDTVQIVLSSTSGNTPPTTPFFGLRGANLTIAAASGTTIPGITSQATGDELSWSAGTLTDRLIDTGLALSNSNKTAATSSTGASTSVTVTSAPQIRSANWMKVKITHGNGTVTYDTYATTATTQMMPTIPAAADDCIAIHSQQFYNMTAASTASAIATEINGSNSGLSGRYSAAVSGNTVTLTQTSGYSSGDTIELVVWNYTQQ